MFTHQLCKNMPLCVKKNSAAKNQLLQHFFLAHKKNLLFIKPCKPIKTQKIILSKFSDFSELLYSFMKTYAPEHLRSPYGELPNSVTCWDRSHLLHKFVPLTKPLTCQRSSAQ